METLAKTIGQIQTSQIIVLWQECLKLKKNGESMIEFLNKMNSIVIKLQSADEKISDNLKIAIVLKALPQEYDSFIATIQFQKISYLQLKERLIEQSLEGAQTNKIRVLRPLRLKRFIELAEDDTMEELDKETRKP